MAKAYKRLRGERTERRLKNQSFMEPSKSPLSGKRKKSLETECSPQFFEPVSANQPRTRGNSYASFLTPMSARSNGFGRYRGTVIGHRARAVTCC
jgi:hypothetical protein